MTSVCGSMALDARAIGRDKTAMIEDIRGLFALGTDITEADEITAVTDARGVVLIPGRLRVEGPIQHKHTHVEAALKRIA